MVYMNELISPMPNPIATLFNFVRKLDEDSTQFYDDLFASIVVGLTGTKFDVEIKDDHSVIEALQLTPSNYLTMKILRSENPEVLREETPEQVRAKREQSQISTFSVDPKAFPDANKTFINKVPDRFGLNLLQNINNKEAAVKEMVALFNLEQIKVGEGLEAYLERLAAKSETDGNETKFWIPIKQLETNDAIDLIIVAEYEDESKKTIADLDMWLEMDLQLVADWIGVNK